MPSALRLLVAGQPLLQLRFAASDQHVAFPQFLLELGHCHVVCQALQQLGLEAGKSNF